MECTIEISKGAFSAVAMFASKKDVRHYLRGVHMETGPTGAFFVATDGRALAAVHVAGDFAESAGIIPAELVAIVRKGTRGALSITIATEAGEGSRPRYSVAGMAMAGIDGKFPDWRRLVPTEEPSGIAAQFDPELVARYGAAARLLGRKSTGIVVAHNGPERAARVLVSGQPEFLGVMMPYRYSGGAEMPDWFQSRG